MAVDCLSHRSDGHNYALKWYHQVVCNFHGKIQFAKKDRHQCPCADRLSCDGILRESAGVAAAGRAE